MNPKTKKLVLFAILAAILIIMAFTPVGYLKIGIVEITFIMIPVIICAAACGPLYGGLMGLLFGLTSFVQCFGMSAFGALLLSLNPFFTVLCCIVPRVALGVFSGFVFRALRQKKLPPVLPESVTMLSSAIVHTLLFVGLLMLCFGRTEEISSFGNNFWSIIWALVGTNGLIEWAVCATIGAGVLKAVRLFMPDIASRNNKKTAEDSGR